MDHWNVEYIVYNKTNEKLNQQENFLPKDNQIHIEVEIQFALCDGVEKKTI